MMDLEKFLTLAPTQARNSLRVRSQESKDKAKATLRENWLRQGYREKQAAMLRDYWSSCDSPMKGKRGALNKTSRAVVTPFGEFGSGSEAARVLGITSAGIRYRILRGWTGYSYVDPPPDWIVELELKRRKPRQQILEVVTPLGRFSSMKEASVAHGYKGIYTLFNRFKVDPANYYRVYKDD